MTTPAAVPAVPAAAVAPVAPVVAPVVPPVAVTPPAAVVAPVVPAAPVAPVVPAAPVAVVPAAPVAASLLDNGEPPPEVPQTPEEKLTAAKKLIADAEAAADPNGRNPDGTKTAWLLEEGVMGTGEKPGWFKSDKYKSVAAQAAAYPELEKRLGTFVGAPKDGKYEIAAALKDVVQADHPMLEGFTKWAGTKQLSQDGYNELIGMLAQYDAGFAPQATIVTQAIGENAGGRIGAVMGWAKANLDPEGVAALRAATSLDGNMHPNARVASAFKALEKVIAKTGQLKMPKPGVDVPGGQAAEGLAAIQAEHRALDASGKPKVNTVPGYREMIDKKYQAYYAAQG